VPLTKRKIDILLAEDNADDVFFFRDAFKKAGGTGVLHTVSDGLEAVAYLSAEGDYNNRVSYPFPDVLLLDLNMPQMNGFEVLDWVRQNPKCGRLIVHVLTSSCRETDIQRAYDLRAISYVVKPIQVEQLVAFVSTLHEWHQFLALPTSEDCAAIGSLADALP